MTSVESIYSREHSSDIQTHCTLENYFHGKRAFYICFLVNGGALIFYGSLTSVVTIVLTVQGWIEINIVNCMHTIYLHCILWVSADFAIICGILIFIANHSKGRTILIVTIMTLLIVVIIIGIMLVKDENMNGIKLTSLNLTYNNPKFNQSWINYEKNNNCCGIVDSICKDTKPYSVSCYDIILYNTGQLNRKIRLFASIMLPSLITCCILGVITLLCLPNINKKVERYKLCKNYKIRFASATVSS